MESLKNQIVKKYTKKNGDEVVKTYNQQKYNNTYYSKNKDKINKTYKCVLCDKEINHSNKSNHEKTKIHILKSKYDIDFKQL
jgi:hypothetical protein